MSVRVSLAGLYGMISATVPDALIRYRAIIYDGFFFCFVFRAPKNAVMIRGYPKHNATFLSGVSIVV